MVTILSASAVPATYAFNLPSDKTFAEAVQEQQKPANESKVDKELRIPFGKAGEASVQRMYTDNGETYFSIFTADKQCLCLHPFEHEIPAYYYPASDRHSDYSGSLPPKEDVKQSREQERNCINGYARQPVVVKVTTDKDWEEAVYYLLEDRKVVVFYYERKNGNTPAETYVSSPTEEENQTMETYKQLVAEYAAQVPARSR